MNHCLLKNFLKISIVSAFFLLTVFWDVRIFAASDIAILDWQTFNYVPSWYQGRNLSVIGSEVKVGATVLDSQKAAKYFYRWLVDGRLVKDWGSFREITFMVNKRETEARLVIGEKKIVKDIFGKKVDKIVVVSQLSQIIIAVEPEIFLYYSGAGENIKRSGEAEILKGDRLDFTAIPYFYNISGIKDLKFGWRFLDKTVSGQDSQPHKLTLKIPENSGTGSGFLNVYSSLLDGNLLKSDRIRIIIK